MYPFSYFTAYLALLCSAKLLVLASSNWKDGGDFFNNPTCTTKAVNNAESDDCYALWLKLVNGPPAICMTMNGVNQCTTLATQGTCAVQLCPTDGFRSMDCSRIIMILEWINGWCTTDPLSNGGSQVRGYMDVVNHGAGSYRVAVVNPAYSTKRSTEESKLGVADSSEEVQERSTEPQPPLANLPSRSLNVRGSPVRRTATTSPVAGTDYSFNLYDEGNYGGAVLTTDEANGLSDSVMASVNRTGDPGAVMAAQGNLALTDQGGNVGGVTMLVAVPWVKTWEASWRTFRPS